MSRRRLHPDELALWQRVAGTAEPLHPKTDVFARDRANGTKKAETPALRRRPQAAVPVGRFEMSRDAAPGAARHDILPGIAERIAAAPLRMDRKAHARLKRGKLEPDVRIDLHGMTLDRARSALVAFILNAHARDHRLVLVITGKGKRSEDRGPIPTQPGALRHQVPHWLGAPPLSQAVLQIAQAHRRHGGEGAYYVYLRRRRE